MDRLDFAKYVSRLRAIETKLLDKTKIERMKDASSLDEVLRILGETEYAAAASSIKKPEDYEMVLSRELKNLYQLMYELTPERKIIDLFSLRYDYHNIKVLLKGKYSGKSFDDMLINVGTIPAEKLSDYIKNNDYRDLDPLLREAIENTQHDYQETKDSQRIDLILDKYLYKDMLIRSEQLSNEFLLKFTKINIDLINIKTFLRVKKQKKGRDFLKEALLNGGSVDNDVFLNSLNDSVDNLVSRLSYTDYYKIMKTGLEDYDRNENIIGFERLADDFLMNIIKDTKLISFGAEPIAAYIVAKETEIKLLRIILVGKLNNIPSEVLGERLRDSYV
ncbi:MAG: V-type ATP synthase subunit C [Bacillota bacterium]|nr:V-type ATP synthase subunit C [Bacillota bacterium]